jgi:hypothetical protein
VEAPLLECWVTVRLVAAVQAVEAALLIVAVLLSTRWWQTSRTELQAQLLAAAIRGGSLASARRRRLTSRLKHYAQRRGSREGHG